MRLSLRRPRRQAPPEPACDSQPSSKNVFLLREAGLVTTWYLAQRCEEECYRAGRYRRPLALLLAAAEPGADETTVQNQMRDWLSAELRMTDVPAYLGSARYAILLPETGRAGAAKLAARMCASVPQVCAARATFPRDGRTFGELVAAAKSQLDALATLDAHRLAA